MSKKRLCHYDPMFEIWLMQIMEHVAKRNEELMGHGHVKPNASGTVARCGGPSICAVCRREEQELKGFTKVEKPCEVPANKLDQHQKDLVNRFDDCQNAFNHLQSVNEIFLAVQSDKKLAEDRYAEAKRRWQAAAKKSN